MHCSKTQVLQGSSLVLLDYNTSERSKRAWGHYLLPPTTLHPNTLTLWYPTPIATLPPPHPHPHPTPLLSHTLQHYLLSCYQCPTLPHLIRVKNSTILHYLTLSRSKFTIQLHQLQCSANT